MAEAFGGPRAAKRVLGQRHFDVQHGGSRCTAATSPNETGEGRPWSPRFRRTSRYTASVHVVTVTYLLVPAEGWAGSTSSRSRRVICPTWIRRAARGLSLQITYAPTTSWASTTCATHGHQLDAPPAPPHFACRRRGHASDRGLGPADHLRADPGEVEWYAELAKVAGS